MNSICEILTSDRRVAIVRALTAAGYGFLADMVEPLHRAICGDAETRSAVLAEVQTACACKGKTPPPATFLEQLARSVDVIHGGQSGMASTASGAARLPLDWNCRTSTGDVEGCQLTELMSDPYPLIKLTPTEITDTTGLPPAPIGSVWYEVPIASIPVSARVCLESFVIEDVGGTPIVPQIFALQGEKIARDDAAGIVHVWDFPQRTARSGWEITANRCRCIEPPCVCLPAQARARFVFLADAVPDTAELELYRDPKLLATEVCGPCPPTDRCGRAVLARCECTTPDAAAGGADAPPAPTPADFERLSRQLAAIQDELGLTDVDDVDDDDDDDEADAEEGGR